jgi:hypothetical protein
VILARFDLTLELGSVLAGIATLLVAITTFLNSKLNKIDHQVNGGEVTLHDRLDVIEERISLLNDKIEQLKGGDSEH